MVPAIACGLIICIKVEITVNIKNFLNMDYASWVM